METVDKRIEVAVEQTKENKIVKQIKDLRNDWRGALLINGNCKEVDVKENRYHWYVKGIEDALGFAKTCEFVSKSREK